MPGEDLHWLLTLAELEHVGAAADRLHLSQPTLSRMLARLERRLGVALFDRHGKRLALNDFGRIYYEHARRAQAELDAAGRELADLADPAMGVVRLSFLHSFGARLVPELIAGFRRGSGRITFTLSQDAAAVVTARVLDGTADLGLVSPKPAATGLGWHTLLRQRLALGVPANHRLAGRRQIRLAEVAEAEFIAMHPGFGMRRILDDLCAAADFRPRIGLESSDLVTVAGLVAAGLGVAVLPLEEAPVRGPQPGPVLIPLADPGASRAVGLIWSADSAPSDAVRRFRSFAVEWAQR
ncbi:LysR family transcriptional regulator [Nocardia pseudobrasiliensis]|uniref:DNA-binding transcriptional LysR family regulator n=1 Tax=Nocardia pseudobrasiliensis TaxID=45979 RepID=A0A370HZS4_9NOCA|nr:LysR family transcriptional regulator [Nocardia pseudobrasiliensis]RDI64005.1 DNA-binding transcriptional LysR family regulator [Nocardia pseudobrasiliensis]